MRIETMKSVILIILIAFSLLLSVALWNYQPEMEYVAEEATVDKTRLEEVGHEMSLAQLVEPVQFVFHQNSAHYSFGDNEVKSEAYEAMKQWSLLPSNTLSPLPDEAHEGEMVEIIFSSHLPLMALNHIFTIENVELNRTTTFDRLYILKNGESQSASDYILWAVDSSSKESPEKFQASLANDAGEQLFQELEDKDSLVEQIQITTGGGDSEAAAKNIYIPKESRSYPDYPLQTEPVGVLPLQNFLFPVTKNVKEYFSVNGGKSYADKDRMLSIVADDKRMEYVYMIPNQANPVNIEEYELLTKSISDINSHLGWTNTFKLDRLAAGQDHVEYRMYFEDLPVLSNENHLQMITLSYEQATIQTYNRPLVRFTPVLNEAISSSQLRSGEEVVEFLSQKYDMNTIENVRVGYRLVEQASSLYYSLQPAWFMLQTGNDWKEIKFNQLSQNEEVS